MQNGSWLWWYDRGVRLAVVWQPWLILLARVALWRDRLTNLRSDIFENLVGLPAMVIAGPSFATSRRSNGPIAMQQIAKIYYLKIRQCANVTVPKEA